MHRISAMKPPENCQNPTIKAMLEFKNCEGCLTTNCMVLRPYSISFFTYQCINMTPINLATNLVMEVAITLMNTLSPFSSKLKSM